MTSPKSLKRLRTFSHKSRLGCLACKQRHLKCDEGKPSCQKCTRANSTCVYVDVQPSARVPEQTQLLALAPKQSRSHEAVGITSSLRQQPSILKLKTSHEARYFESFCSNIAMQLSGLFDLSLWNRLILQTSEEEESVRLGIIALGALQYSIDLKGRQNGRYLASFTPDDEHHCFAVEHYHISIKLSRHHLTLRKHSLRTTLLNCLLAICFETMHGNYRSAIAQMDVGIRLLDGYIAGKRISAPDSKITKDETPPSFALESPAPLEIEDELVQAFTRLDTQANSFLDSRPLEYHMTMKMHGSDCIAGMPTRYINIDEARKYHELLGRRISHWVSSLGRVMVHHNEYSVFLDGQNVGILMNWDCLLTDKIPLEIFLERQGHMDDLERWWVAFRPLLARYQHQTGSKEYLCIVSLCSKFIAMRLMLTMSLSTNQLAYDNLVDEFRELLRLVKILHLHPLAQGPLSLDLGYIAQLYTIAFKCRDRHIRREASNLLLSRPWREGLWESNITGRICSAVIDLEEEGLQGDFVPNEARMKSMTMKCDLQKKESRMACLMTTGEVKDRVIMW